MEDEHELDTVVKADPVPDPPKEVEPPKADPPADTRDELQETIKSLVDTVADLSNRVASLEPQASDSVPTGRPWTHRGGR